MKVSLDAQDAALKAERRARWGSLSAPTRKAVKDQVTGAIGASGTLARSAASLVISKIGAIEIIPGENGWPELLPGLLAAATNGS
jgi:hypothetical protein